MDNCAMEVDTMQEEVEGKKEVSFEEWKSEWGDIKNDGEIHKYCSELKRISSEYKLLKEEKMKPRILPFTKFREILDPISEIKKANKDYHLESNIEYQEAKSGVLEFDRINNTDPNENKLYNEFNVLYAKLIYLRGKVVDYDIKKQVSKNEIN